MSTETMKPGRLIPKLVGAAALVMFGTIGACSSIYIVDTGHVGVERRFREVQGTLMPGFHIVNPITTDVIEMDVRTLKWAAETQVYTKDIQQAQVRFVLNYNLDPSAADRVYATVGPDWSNKLVGQVVHETIKAALGQFNAVDLISQREAASTVISTKLKNALLTKDVVVTAFQITNLDYSPSFEKAVEEKVVAQQEAIKEQNRTVQIEEQAKQAIATARGRADSTVLLAKAEAESIRIRAEALAENPRLVELVTAEKWNGVLPTQMYGAAPVPFINVPQTK